MISTFPAVGRRVVSGLACAVALTGTVACTGGSDPPSAEPSSTSADPSPTPATRPVPMTVRVTQVSGRLSKSQRSNLERKVGQAISAYFDDAFLTADYPGADFDDAFASFTKGAARNAQRDRDLLTNADLAESTESVTAKRRKVSLSVLAPNRSAAGVTARIRLVLVADQGQAGATRVTTSGRLLLTHRKSGGWWIFGYDVARSAVPVKRGVNR